MTSKSDEIVALTDSLHRIELRSGRSLDRDPTLQTEHRRQQSRSPERLSSETEPQKIRLLFCAFWRRFAPGFRQ